MNSFVLYRRAMANGAGIVIPAKAGNHLAVAGH